MLEMNKRSEVYCKNHEDKPVEFYCSIHNELICSLCVWDHADHKYCVKACLSKDIIQYVECLKVELNKMEETILF